MAATDVGSRVMGSQAMPQEWWERVRDGVRARLVAALVARPRLLTALRRSKVWLLWAALIFVIGVVIVSHRYRASIKTYAYCFALLILWFAIARMKTIRWGSLTRMFSFGVGWAVVIAAISYRLIHAIGLTAGDAGPGTAIAGFTEESLKLVPLIAVAVLAPGRVRRFGATDWLLLGFAAGLGFQAWEELLRRLTASLSSASPGLLDILAGTSSYGPGSGYPQYGFGLLSGGSGSWRGNEVWGYAGHHVFTGLIAASIGLGIAAWRRADTRVRTSRMLLVRVTAIALPVLMWFLCVCDHVSYNSALRDTTWPSADHISTPGIIRTVWKVTGEGTGKGWLLLILLLACLLVDAGRLQQAGAWTDLPDPVPPTPEQEAAEAAAVAAARAAAFVASPGTAPGYPVPRALTAKFVPPYAGSWWLRPRDVVGWQLATRFSQLGGPMRTLVTAVIALGVHVARDITVIIAAHSRGPGQSRFAALISGRAAAMMLREVRERAIAERSQRVIIRVNQRGEIDPVAVEIRRRRLARLVAAGGLLLLLAAGTLLAASIAKQVGTDLTPPPAAHDLAQWLAGQFDSLANWWSGLGTGQKILVGVGVAALIGLSGGSLTLAFGASGVLTYGLEHGHGVSDLITDPGAATRNYLDTASPGQIALDTLDFALTFAPGNFAGAAAGKGARALGREFAESPAAFLERQRQAVRNARESFSLDAFRRGQKLEWGSDASRRQWISDQLNNPDTTRRAAYGKPDDIAYQTAQAGPTEVRLTTPDGQGIWADGVGADPDKVVAIEAKYIRNPGGRSIYEGTAPDFVSKNALAEFDSEMRRYAAVMADPSNPVGRLRLVTSTPKAAKFIAERARSILGNEADIVVVVAP